MLSEGACVGWGCVIDYHTIPNILERSSEPMIIQGRKIRDMIKFMKKRSVMPLLILLFSWFDSSAQIPGGLA